jgi:hypothetical protein
MIRARVSAVAVRAVASPRRAAIRRQNAPSALVRRCTGLAAHRNACAARCTPGRGARACPLPPDGFGCGAQPRPLPPGCSRGHRCMSVPIARTTPRAGLAAIPSSAVSATPVPWCRRGRAAHGPALSWRRRTRRGGSSGGTSGHAMPVRGASSPRSPSRIGSWSESYNARDGGKANRGAGCHVPCSARAGLRTRLAALVAAWGPRLGGAFAPPHGPAHTHAGQAREVADHGGELPGPRRQRLRAPLQMPSGVCEPRGAMPLRGPPHAAGRLGPAGRRAPPETVEALAPLAVVHVGGGAVGGALPLAGIAPQPLEAGVLQPVVERAPVHARGFPGHRRSLARPPPGRAGVQVGRDGPEAADVRGQEGGGARGRRGRAGARRDPAPSRGRPDSEARGGRMARLQEGCRGGGGGGGGGRASGHGHLQPQQAEHEGDHEGPRGRQR